MACFRGVHDRLNGMRRERVCDDRLYPKLRNKMGDIFRIPKDFGMPFCMSGALGFTYGDSGNADRMECIMNVI